MAATVAMVTQKHSGNDYLQEVEVGRVPVSELN